MLKKGIVFLLCLGLLISGIVLVVDFGENSPKVWYGGDVTFDLEKDYECFKGYLMQPEVEIEEIQILASEPPIWVKYQVQIPRELPFPYSYDSKGCVTGTRGTGYCAMVAFGFLASLFSGFLLFTKEGV